MTKKYDIFISHAKEDNKLAFALCHFMEERQFRCWVAPRDVQAGKDYATCIIEGIQSSSIMIIILSEFSNRSNHVRNEVERAFNHQIAILPFRIRDVIPEQSLEYFLSSYHWLDAIDGQAESYFEELYRHCFALLRSEQPVDPPKPFNIPKQQSDYGSGQTFKKQTDPPIKKTQDDPWYKNKAAQIAGAVIAGVVLFFILLRPLFDKNTIEFKNNTTTPVYIDLDGKTDTIRSLSGFNYKGRKNSRVKAKASTYWTNVKGELLGQKMVWTIDTVVHADGDFTYPLNVGSNYFFLKVTNTSNANINYIRVNGNDSAEKDVINIKIPNDGVNYYVGYFKILSGTTVELWNTNNYYLKWTNGSNLTFYNNYNQDVTLSYK